VTNLGAARTIVEPLSTQNTSDRRIYPRLSSDALSVAASITIPNRPAVTLVDLSQGGARIDLPFQMSPDARVNLEFRAASERMMLPFRLLRCYVASLKGGVMYRAAGTFDNEFDWQPLLGDVRAQTTSTRLIRTLEAFLRHDGATGRSLEFDQLLISVLDAARRGERGDRIAVEIRMRLMRIIPSIVIQPVTTPSLPDPARGARSFGFDFRSERALSTPDRRILRAAAQLLSIVSANEAARPAPPLDFKPRQPTDSGVITYSVADWQATRQGDTAARRDRWKQSA
jgi:hypothetical protein